MSSEVEAAGAAVTAGLAASAIQQGAGRSGDAHGACANCGAELGNRFCPQCGQPAHIHRTLGHMAEEFLHGILHFDTRAWKTLPLLLFRPGTLTHSYVHGKRARFISPLAIFLLTVFTMFFVFSLSGGSQVGVGDGTLITTSATDLGRGLADIRDAEKALAAIEASPTPTDAAARAERVQRLSEAQAAVIAARATLNQTNERLAEERAATPAPDSTVESAEDEPSLWEEIAADSRSGELSVNTGWKTLDKKIREKLENPELFVYKLQNTAYKFSFLLVPISLPFLWLMFFWKRGVTLFDHSVFILYSLSFVSLLFIALSLSALTTSISGLVVTAVTFGLPVHAYFHLKGAYSLGWFSAFWRTWVLLIFAALSLAIFLLAIVALGFVG